MNETTQTVIPAYPPLLGTLSAGVLRLARQYLAARRRSGEALLEAARILSMAREAAQHGEWQTFLEATHTSADTAEGLLRIYAESQADPAFAEAVRSNWLSQSAAALVARESTPDAARERILAGVEAPSAREVRAIIKEEQEGAKIRNVAENDKTEVDDSAAFEDARRRYAALGWKLERHGVWYKLIAPSGKHYATTQTLEPQLATLQTFEAGGARLRAAADDRSAPLDPDLTVGQRADPHKPDPKEPPPAADDAAAMIRAAVERAALSLGMLVEPDGDRVRLRWPDENAAHLDSLPWDEARDWIESEGRGLAMARQARHAPPCEDCGETAVERRNLGGVLAWRCQDCAARAEQAAAVAPDSMEAARLFLEAQEAALRRMGSVAGAIISQAEYRKALFHIAALLDLLAAQGREHEAPPAHAELATLEQELVMQADALDDETYEALAHRIGDVRRALQGQPREGAVVAC